jgi:hypothetical protein
MERVVVRSSHLAAGITGVDDPCWLDEQRVDFAVCDRAVLDTLWHDEQLSRLQCHVAITQLDGQLAVDDDEQLVGVLVRVPDELTPSPSQP